MRERRRVSFAGRGTAALGAVLAVVFLAAAECVRAQPERILGFESVIVVKADGSLLVTESITVYAGGNQIKRGIFRDFPTLYKGKFGFKKKTEFEVLGVLKNGQPEHYAVENIQGGERVRIGRAHKFLDQGEYTYEITYETNRQLGFFENHDELYWNVTGNFWAFPIDRATARVELPAGAEVLSHEAYTGAGGSKGTAYRSSKESRGVAFFETTAPLRRGEGLTVVVTWPKGHVDAAAAKGVLADNPAFASSVFGLVAVLGYFVVAWFKVGVDPERGVIFPLYEAPEGFSPAAVRYLYRMGFDNKAFSAAVIGLAVKGVLKIEEKKKGDYKLVRSGGAGRKLTPDELALFHKLLGKKATLALKQKNHKKIGGAKTALSKALAKKLEKTHFVSNFKYWIAGLILSLIPVLFSLLGAEQIAPALFMVFWLSIWTVATTALISAAVSAWRAGTVGAALGATFFALPFTLGWFGGLFMLTMAAGVPAIVIFVVCAVVNGVFYHLLKAPTHMGRKLLDEIEGFKEYLGVAEEERLNLINPPERTPELFERYLPFALALDVDQEWSEKFSSVLAAASAAPAEGGKGYRPSWYGGVGSASDISSGSFASSLGSSMTSALASSSSAPGSSSGSGGGGSSGGGGGGGGGGGW